MLALGSVLTFWAVRCWLPGRMMRWYCGAELPVHWGGRPRSTTRRPDLKIPGFYDASRFGDRHARMGSVEGIGSSSENNQPSGFEWLP
jgi:hypothetical protein